MFLFKHIRRSEPYCKESGTEQTIGEYETVRPDIKRKFSTASTVRFYDNFNKTVVA